MLKIILRSTLKNYFLRYRRIIAIIIRFIIIIFPSAYLFIYLFNPLYTFNLDNRISDKETTFIPMSNINKIYGKTLIGDFFQINLDLSWYNLCVENQGVLQIKGVPILTEDKMDGRGNIEITITEKGFNKENRLSIAPNNKKCIKIKNESEGLEIYKKNFDVILGAYGNNKLQDITRIDEKKWSIEYKIDFTKLHILLKNDVFSLVIKFFVLLLLWSGIIILISSIYKFILGR